MMEKKLSSEVRMAVLTMDTGELNELIEVIRARRAALNSMASCMIKVGDRVMFNGKYGRTVEGTVSRRVKGHGNKFDIFPCNDGMRWRVAASSLTPVTKK